MSPSSTSSSDDQRAVAADRAGVRALALRLAVFALPLASLIGVLELGLWRSGETAPLAWVSARQAAGEKLLFDREIFETPYLFLKREGVRQRRPAIVAVGSSRALQFRDLMFAPHEREFFNAGRTIDSVDDVDLMVDYLIETSPPRAVVLVVDPWIVKQDPPDRLVSQFSTDRDTVLTPAAHVYAQRQLLRQRRLPESLTAAEKFGPYEPVGLRARRGNGFRPDGSYLYGEAVALSRETPGYRDREVPPVIDRVRERTRQFTPSAGLDAKLVAQLQAAIERLRAQGVDVVAVFPPVSSEVDQAASAAPDMAQWWEDYWNKLPAALERAGARTVVLRRPSDAGLSDEYMFDGFHLSEVVAALLAEQFPVGAPPESPLADIDPARLAELRDRDAVIPLSLGIEGQ